VEPLTARIAAGLGACCGVFGGILVVYAVAALPSPWTGGFVSEAGVPGAPHPLVYRFGIAGLAAGLALLGVAVLSVPPIPVPRLPTVPPWLFLVSAGAFTMVSGSVPCTRECPLPPYEPTTARDLVHGGTSMLAVALATAAMLLLAASTHDPVLRTVSRVAAGCCVPVLLALAVSLAATGRSESTAVLERAGLAGVLVWAVVAGTRIATRTPVPEPERVRTGP
jgi:hypothetical protein